jgi:virulence factor Mce-like protein
MSDWGTSWAWTSFGIGIESLIDSVTLTRPSSMSTPVTVQGDQVRVDMEIPDDIPIPNDATAQIVPQSLIGERYVQLSPAFKTGDTPAKDGYVIPKSRTITPVEPDEALAAVKKFLDSLDPHGLGRLVDNLNDDLKGNGAELNRTLGSLSKLVSTFAEKDQQLGNIVDSFDKLTRTLSTRDTELGQVLDAFAQVSQVLADERNSISGLVNGLALVSRDGLQLVGKHQADLRTDIETLTQAAATVNANLDSVSKLLDAGGILPKGLRGAYDPTLRAINLRDNFSPLVDDILAALLGNLLGTPSLCVPTPLNSCGVAGAQAAPATPAQRSDGPTPISALLALLSAPTTAPDPPGPSVLSRLRDRVGDGARTLVGVGS